jgi:ADP-heptose:LPS heptosyltransferase
MTTVPPPYPGPPPRRILLLKGHSAGIGDLLRSSAAWRALRNRFPEVQLHLWFLTRDPGAPAEQLIARHHLLAGFHVSDKRAQGPGWKQLLSDASAVLRQAQPDLIIDFEPNGVRTSLLAWYLGLRARAVTVGIAQVPGRGWFYARSAPSTRAYARAHGIDGPPEYVDRDFVALAALGLDRAGLAIELRETDEGRAFRVQLLAELGNDNPRKLLGLNIGCGTPDAVGKRPDLDLLRGLIAELQRRYGFGLLLTGAPFEQEVNRQFLSRYRPAGPVMDLAGRTNMLQLAGAIAACRLFISSDSGPYHMAVALRVPTLAVFKWPNPLHYHHHDWVECHVAPDVESLPALVQAAERLLHTSPHTHPHPPAAVAPTLFPR